MFFDDLFYEVNFKLASSELELNSHKNRSQLPVICIPTF